MLSAERLKLINSESDVGKKYGRIEQDDTAGSEGHQAGDYFAFILQTSELFYHHLLFVNDLTDFNTDQAAVYPEDHNPPFGVVPVA